MRLTRLILALLLFLTFAGARAAGPDAREIAPGILLLPGQLQPNFNPDGNSVIVRGDDGLLVVDSGRGGLHSRNLLALLRQLNLPVQALVNTHWHLDHIGGNALLKRELPGLKVHAHPSLDTALEGFHAENRAKLEAYVPTLPEGSQDLHRWNAELGLLRNTDFLVAGEKIRSPGRISAGNRPLEVRIAAQAVTEGDVWLFDAQTRTLIAGDLVTLPVPLFDTACPERWQTALRDLATQDFKLLVPGHGAPLNPVQLKRYRKAYDNLLACADDEDQDDNSCVDGWFKDAGPLVAPGQMEYGRTLLTYYLPNNLRPESAGRKRWCNQ